MTNQAAKAVKAAVSLLLLLGASACANQTAPTMLDYSYIPPNQVTASTSNYGIDDF